MKNLKILREANGLSQQKLAEVFDISQQSIYKYENSLAEPDIQTLIAMADYFDTSVDYLIGNSSNPQPFPITNADELTKKELEFISNYRKLTPHAQELFFKLVREYGV